jgi:Putative zinc-finger
MMRRPDCREIRQSLGVYVVGAIDPAERAMVDDHLAYCPECREELADLAGLPAFLHRVPVEEARLLAAGGGEALLSPPPEELLDSLLDRVAEVRRARRWRTLVAAAAVAVVALGAGAAGAGALTGAFSSAPAASHSAMETVSGSADGYTLTVRYRPTTYGTELDTQVKGIPTGTVCQLRVSDAKGHHWLIGGWRVAYQDDHIWYPATTALSAASMRRVDVLSQGKVMVTAWMR